MAASKWIFLLVSLFAVSAFAEDRPLLVVLDFEAKGAQPLQAQAATEAAVRGLRDLDVFQVLSSDDVRQLLAIERGRQLVGEGDQGAASVGKALGAQHVVAGSVTLVGNDLTVELRLLDTKAATVVNHRVLGPVSAIEKIATQLPGVAQELVGPLLEAQQGSVLVRSNEESADVMVDGVLRGTTPLTAPIKLPRGTHRVELRKDGFITQAQPARIQPDEVTVLDVTLVPSPEFASAYKERYGKLRLGAWIASGVAVASLASAYFIDRRTSSLYDNDFRPRQELLQAELGGSQTIPDNVATNAHALAIWNNCSLDPQACRTTAQDLQSSIKLREGVTYGLVGLGVVSAGTAAYLWFTGKDPNRYSGLSAGIIATDSTKGFALSGSF